MGALTVEVNGPMPLGVDLAQVEERYQEAYGERF